MLLVALLVGLSQRYHVCLLLLSYFVLEKPTLV